jgi:hypothetical protein
MLDREPVRAGGFGNLLFNAATAAVQSGNGDRARDLLAIARSAAVRSGQDKASEAAIFGPRVAAMQAVDQAVRLDDPETALRLAKRVPAAAGDEVPAFWEAGHRLHLARAALELRRDKDAVEYLAPRPRPCSRLGPVPTAGSLRDAEPGRPGTTPSRRALRHARRALRLPSGTRVTKSGSRVEPAATQTSRSASESRSARPVCLAGLVAD